MKAALTGKQRQFLKGLAHPLSPVVRVGRMDPGVQHEALHIDDEVPLAAT